MIDQIPVPGLSIIIPNYNNAVYLDECLESVMAQNFRDFEAIIADDGSTDGSVELIQGWASRFPGNIRMLLNPINLGVPSNLHQAIELSRGTYVTTLDADDFYADSCKLDREMAVVLQHQERGESVIAFSDIAVVQVDRSLRGLNSDWAPIREGFILSDILSRSCLVPRDFIMPRAAYFAVGGYDPDILFYDDWDLKIRLAEHFPFYYSGGIGTAYRQHGKGIASRPWADLILWLARVFEKNLQRIAPERRDEIRSAFDLFIAGITRRNIEEAHGKRE